MKLSSEDIIVIITASNIAIDVDAFREVPEYYERLGIVQLQLQANTKKILQNDMALVHAALLSVKLVANGNISASLPIFQKAKSIENSCDILLNRMEKDFGFTQPDMQC